MRRSEMEPWCSTSWSGGMSVSEKSWSKRSRSVVACGSTGTTCVQVGSDWDWKVRWVIACGAGTSGRGTGGMERGMWDEEERWRRWMMGEMRFVRNGE